MKTRQRELDRLPSLIHVTSNGYDDTLAGVGSSPFALFDLGSTFLRVPKRPTVPDLVSASSNRYLFRLCSHTVPAGMAARLIRVGEYTEIGCLVPDTVYGGNYQPRLEVTTPSWSFSDGNVARGITLLNLPARDDLNPTQLAPGLSRNLSNTNSALIVGDNGLEFPYEAPMGGVFPGSPLEGLGPWRDKLFGWSHSSSPLDYAIEGPCIVTYWASVKQTDPLSRVRLTATDEEIAALCPEDRFVMRFPSTVYTRIGGFMVLEQGPTMRFAHREDP